MENTVNISRRQSGDRNRYPLRNLTKEEIEENNVWVNAIEAGLILALFAVVGFFGVWAKSIIGG